jgi:PAS domain S-box-containing protein
MENPSNSGKNQKELWRKLIGLGELSVRKSYYPELQRRLGELERFRALLDNSNDLIFLLEVPSGKIIDVNESACRQMGCSRNKLIGLTFFDCTDRKSKQKLEKIISSDHPATPGRKVVCNLRASDGNPFPTEVTLSRMMFEDGEYVSAIARDITERQRAEAILKGRLDSLIQPAANTVGLSFESLFDLDEIQKVQDAFAKATGVASIITDTEGRPITKPSNFCRLCRDIIRKTEKGLTNCRNSDAVLGRVNPKGPIIMPCLSAGLWEGGASICVGDRHIANWLIGQVRNEQLDEEEMLAYAREIGANEEEFRVALAEISVMSAGQFRQLCEALFLMAKQMSTLAYRNVQQARAIHERDRAQEALRFSEERFRSTFESAAAGTAMFSLEGGILQVNPALCLFLGYSENELFKQTVFDSIHPDDREFIRDLFAETLSGERQLFHFEKRFLRKDGSTAWGRASAALVRDVNQKPLYFVGSVQDITEIIKAGEALRASDRMKSEFITTAAHEFRTPLTSIQGFSQVLLTQEDISAEERKEFLTYISERSNALANIVAELLDIARIESGQGLSLNRAPCPVNEVFNQVKPFLKTKATKHRLEVALTEEGTLLNIDKGKIDQVLENLLSNALKYSPEGSLVQIRGALVQKDYRFSVADRGIGMTPEQVAKVFDKFYRGDASHTAVEGVGLGMSVVKHIIEAHGGKIWVESEPGMGTTVSFTVPLDRQVNK